MLTLDRWREFLMPRKIAFPRLELIGLDHAPPIIVGSGEIHMNSLSHFAFTLSGIPSDIRYALAELNRQKQNPYDLLAQFRLVGVDEHGINWGGGWTVPQIDMNGSTWTFSGELQSLTTLDDCDNVSKEAGAEAIFLLRVGDPMAFHLAGYLNRVGEDFRRREYDLEVLGSKIKFAFEASSSTLLITATHSSEFPAHHAENWLAEPLRVLFGQLIFPRLVARNLGNGRAHVSIRQSPGLIGGAGWAALWGKDADHKDGRTFWQTYRQFLTRIARERGSERDLQGEANKVTRLYEECIQASRGSRWVWALTFASSIEALARMLVDDAAALDARERHAAETDEVESLIRYLQSWRGQARLKDIAVSAVRRSSEPTPVRILRGLKEAGVINRAQLDAWNKIRNAVMHGTLISPFSTKEEDAQLIALAEMMHALTRELLRRTVVQ